MNIRLLAAVTLLAATSGGSAATDDPQSVNELVVHEWGTFTSVQGADGVQLSWQPYIQTDLPEFVYRADRNNGGFNKIELHGNGRKGSPAIVRMETPVIYFYSAQERVVDVRVLFPRGRITEWYPQATTVGPYALAGKEATKESLKSAIEWNGVRILPRDTHEITASKLIRGKDDEYGSHYYAARQTDANFVRTTSPYAKSQIAEHERDLFYRGVGFFDAPLYPTVDDSEKVVTLQSYPDERITTMFFLSVRQGMMRYLKVEDAPKYAAVGIELDEQPFGALDDVREQAMRDMKLALVGEGLYAKEAQAMVDTWKDQWFAEEGTRVLYLLPRAWTDKMLPLQISPKPDRVVRVMVGRAELITPSVERELKKQILTYRQILTSGNADPTAKGRAVTAVRQLGLGRFLDPAVRKAIGRNADGAIQHAGWELLVEASQPTHQERALNQSAGLPAFR